MLPFSCVCVSVVRYGKKIKELLVVALNLGERLENKSSHLTLGKRAKEHISLNVTLLLSTLP